jgi:hypothetical protein
VLYVEYVLWIHLCYLADASDELGPPGIPGQHEDRRLCSALAACNRRKSFAEVSCTHLSASPRSRQCRCASLLCSSKDVLCACQASTLGPRSHSAACIVKLY